ncbi:hypothetical protein RRG08_008025, partial [Elysia crispata]
CNLLGLSEDFNDCVLRSSRYAVRVWRLNLSLQLVQTCPSRTAYTDMMNASYRLSPLDTNDVDFKITVWKMIVYSLMEKSETP